MSTDQEFPAPRWMHDSNAQVKGPAIVNEMVDLRRYQMGKKYARCVDGAKRMAARAAGLKVWLAVLQLDCAIELAKPEGSKTLAPLLEALANINQNPKWLLWGPQTETLRPLFAAGQVLRFERQMKLQRRQAWEAYDELQGIRRWLTVDQRARMYRAAGELAFLEQDLGLAMEMMSRSLDQRSSIDVRRRLESIKSTVLAKKEVAPVSGEPVKPTEALIVADASPDERGIIDRMQRAMESGDLLSAIEDGVKLIEKFPGGLAAKWADDRVLELYLSFAAKTEGRFPSLRVKAGDVMVRADPSRLARWANNAYVRGIYPDAARFGEAAIAKYGNHPDSTKLILTTAQAAFYSGDLSGAEKWYERLIKEHGGTEESRAAVFRLGLMHYRAKKWGEAATYFERLTIGTVKTDFEYLALHWLWRAQQKMKLDSAPQTAERLMNRYPVTYYGMRARAELNGGTLTFDLGSAPPIKTEIWLTESQSQSWERFQLLLKAGWFEEAQAELSALPDPLTIEDKLVRARLLAVAFDHLSAIRMYNEAWTEKPEIFSWPSARAAFPVEYLGAIESEAKSTKLEASLIRGVIRQESSFKARAISSANAHGLMQVLPATATEVATMGKWKAALVLPDDLFSPEINIRIGSIYLARLVKAFKGNVPFALASYNAGIGRMRRWVAARPELKDLDSKKTSSPDDEIWIDELPWEETSTYVKAVLRNLLIYQLYGKGSMTLADPLWQSPKP